MICVVPIPFILKYRVFSAFAHPLDPPLIQKQSSQSTQSMRLQCATHSLFDQYKIHTCSPNESDAESAQ